MISLQELLKLTKIDLNDDGHVKCLNGEYKPLPTDWIHRLQYSEITNWLSLCSKSHMPFIRMECLYSCSLTFHTFGDTMYLYKFFENAPNLTSFSLEITYPKRHTEYNIEIHGHDGNHNEVSSDAWLAFLRNIAPLQQSQVTSFSLCLAAVVPRWTPLLCILSNITSFEYIGEETDHHEFLNSLWCLPNLTCLRLDYSHWKITEIRDVCLNAKKLLVVDLSSDLYHINQDNAVLLATEFLKCSVEEHVCWIDASIEIVDDTYALEFDNNNADAFLDLFTQFKDLLLHNKLRYSKVIHKGIYEHAIEQDAYLGNSIGPIINNCIFPLMDLPVFKKYNRKRKYSY